MSKLFDAVAALTERDADYAHGLNGIGWNGTDTGFGHVLYEKGEARWSPKMRKIAHKMIQKYRVQLLSYGIDISDIPKPDDEEAAKASLPARAAGPAPRTTVTAEGDRFVIKIPKGAKNFGETLAAIKTELIGRRYNPNDFTWSAPITPDNRISLHRIGTQWDFDLSAVSQYIEGAEREVQAVIEASKATDADIVIPTLNATLRPFQKAGVAYALDHPKVIIGDDMGLGKTIQALATLEADNAFPALIVCPASVKLNWLSEVQRFLPHRAGRTVVLNGGKVTSLRGADLFIINYDILKKWREELLNVGLRAVVCDESHYLKNGQALRTKAIKGWTDKDRSGRTIKQKGLAEGVQRVILLSGTATINRPSELVAQLQILDVLKAFGGWKAFVTRYCNAYQGPFGWDLTGAANLQELNQKLRALCYVRREKSQVLTELPPLQNALVPFAITNRAEYRKAERDVIAFIRETKGREKATAAERAEHLVKIEALKQLATKGKLEAVTEWIKDFVESEKLVVFATHIEAQTAILHSLEEAGIKCTSILGEHSAEVRQRNKEAFQSDPTIRVIVCSLGAAREGVTLTAASNVAFVELGWTPGGMDQAAARVHRIGQERDSVTAWYLLAEDTIEQDIAQLIDRKRSVTKQVLTGEDAAIEESILGELLERLSSKDDG